VTAPVERTESEPDPFWTDDVQVGEGQFWRSSYAIRLKAHVATERRFGRPQEIVPDITPGGERIYVLAKPYALVPDVTLTVGLYGKPDPHGAAGEVTSADWVGMKHMEVGHAQAWAYPADATLVLWECLLHECATRAPRPEDDASWATLWRSFEAFLLGRIPGVSRIVTPAWDPGYAREVWHAFLRRLSYEELSPAAFAKQLPVSSGP
jgi:hypothetical protein